MRNLYCNSFLLLFIFLFFCDSYSSYDARNNININFPVVYKQTNVLNIESSEDVCFYQIFIIK